ncbi:flagella basal body P-ring formation protein FlgA [Pantoea alhagi]|uniref:flagellar basal body P-ring formation chaperone FlgA n=1 Tax=Mixta sp. BE291 TaxID=3158787 RepID=UPI00285F7B56|nr:flagella basal body P-ring formation protein FlgA [Pantoea alhagi]
MNKLRKIWQSTLLILFSLVAQADNTMLTGKINALLNGADENITDNIKRHVILLTPEDKLASLCTDPQLSMSGNPRLSGNRTVVAQCGNKKHFLQVRIEAQGSWWVAARELKTGSVLSPNDVVQRSGSLANLPSGVVMNPNDFRGAVLTRPLRTGQPLTQNQLRKKWRINRGEEIDIIAHGSGFHIRSRGKALDNAAINDAIRVRMKSGQLVTGSVNSDGSVRINL